MFHVGQIYDSKFAIYEITKITPCFYYLTTKTKPNNIVLTSRYRKSWFEELIKNGVLTLLNR